MKGDTCLIIVLVICMVMMLPYPAPAIVVAGQLDNAESIPAKSLESLSDQVDITETGFDPEVLNVTVDSPVTWNNTTTQTHLLVSGTPYRIYLPLVLRDAGSSSGAPTPGAKPMRAEMSGVAVPSSPGVLFEETLTPGQSFSYTFTLSGTYPYYLATAPQFTGR